MESIKKLDNKMIISYNSSSFFSNNHFNSYSRFYRYYILLVVLSCLINSIAAKPDKPNIISARQLDESTVELKWSVSSLESGNKVDTTYDYENDEKGPLELSRYRVYLSEDDFQRDNIEWPAQADYSIQSLEKKSRGILFAIVDSPSTFDCFRECIGNPICSFASHVYSRENGKYECHLKSNLTNLSVLSGHDNDHELEQSHNSVQILDYQNRALIKNLPPNKKYRFKVTVYDSTSKEWSEVSGPSAEVDMTINVKIEHEKLPDGIVMIKWQQTGEFKNYPLSRYTIRINSVEDEDVLNEMNQLSNLEKIQLVPDYYDFSNQEMYRVHDESICEDLCFSEPKCIRYVYFNDTRCYLLSQLDISNGVYRDSSSSAFSIRGRTNDYRLESLLPDAEYQVKLEFRTLFGSVGESNTITIKRDTEENFPRKNPLDDPIDNRYQDHPMVKKNPSEQTYLVNLFKNQSNSAAEFDCMSEGNPLWEVEWRKMPENKVMSNVKTKRYPNKLYSNLTFKEVKPEDQGTYICQVVKPVIIVKKVNVIVKKIPSKPVILNVTTSEDSTSVKWNTASDGGSILTHAIFEWSKDFNNKNEPIQRRMVPLSLSGKPILFNNETLLGIRLTDEAVRMELSNNVGTSDKSDPFFLKNGKRDPAKGFLKPEEVKGKRICTIWIVVLVLVVILVIAVLAFIVYKTRQSNQAAAASTNNEERNKFIVIN